MKKVCFRKLIGVFDMKYRKLGLIVIFFILAFNAFSQETVPYEQSNADYDFDDFLFGVRFAEVYVSPEQQSSLTSGDALSEVYFGLKEFLSEMGFEYVDFSGHFNTHVPSSYCEVTRVMVTFGMQGENLKNLGLSFYSCNGDYWTFEGQSLIPVFGMNPLRLRVKSNLKKICKNYRGAYNPDRQLSMVKYLSDWNEEKLKNYFDKGLKSPFEGIYEVIDPSSSKKMVVGLVKLDEELAEDYMLIYLNGATNYLDWTEGEVKALFRETAVSNIFKCSWRNSNKEIDENGYIKVEYGGFNYFIGDRMISFIKMYPKLSDSLVKSTGTGFAISDKGYIVTNYHVIEGANRIFIRGTSENPTLKLEAKVIVSDENSDLAILKIVGDKLLDIKIPYSIKSIPSETGTSVFTLGYPLPQYLGKEVKLTDGIISSKTGFQGSINAYQTTVAVQPGNSGGPLFDREGNLVGVINSKVGSAENVSYAIKSNILLNLLYALDTPVNLPSNSMLRGKSLIEQTKILEAFVYFIEVE